MSDLVEAIPKGPASLKCRLSSNDGVNTWIISGHPTWINWGWQSYIIMIRISKPISTKFDPRLAEFMREAVEVYVRKRNDPLDSVDAIGII